MDALLQAKGILKGKFLATNADDIHTKEDVRKCTEQEWALAVMHMPELDMSSSVRIDANGVITDIIEADKHTRGPGVGGVGLYVLDTRIFEIEPVLLEGRTEYGLPQTMLAASIAFKIPLTAVEISFRLHITSPDDIPYAELALAARISTATKKSF